MSFLPSNYEIPVKEGSYMKFTEPENRFRILGSAITGFELWIEKKPVRRKDDEFTPEELASADINKFTGKKRTPVYFWSFPVFNYKTEKIEILEITQVTIMRGIEDYLNDSDYGKEPWKYDLIVIKDDSKDKVEYRVKAKPPKKIDPGIKKLYEDTHIDLNKLFSGDDPFEVKPSDIPESANK